jgi:hypothetical protein
VKGGLTRRCNGRGFAAPLIAKALGVKEITRKKVSNIVKMLEGEKNK